MTRESTITLERPTPKIARVESLERAQAAGTRGP
jgi:hypothetical protein